MEMIIKQLRQGSQIIVPQTTAEAVLVKHQGNVIRLDQALEMKSGPLSILVNGEQYITRNNKGEDILKLGDDFVKDDDNNIKLNWNNI